MRAEQQTSGWKRDDGHEVFIGPVLTERRDGKNRHYREIFLDGQLIERSRGKSLTHARYNSAFAVERELRIKNK